MVEKFEYLSKILMETFEEVGQKNPLGEVADYIPELSKADPECFGVSLVDLSGKSVGYGDFEKKFSIQSITKVFSLSLCLGHFGEKIFKRVNREPSGNPFNSLVQLEKENGIPRNPFINAGALVISDMLLDIFDDPKQGYLDFLQDISNNDNLSYNPKIFTSEKENKERNAALAYFMKSYGNINNDVDRLLDFYFFQCAIEMNTMELALAFRFLANHGLVPHSKNRVLTASQAKRINALMLTCGFYDEAGDFSYRVGLPGKSGVGGGVVAILPQNFSICSYSPVLNKQGNSTKSIQLLEMFTSNSGESIF